MRSPVNEFMDRSNQRMRKAQNYFNYRNNGQQQLRQCSYMTEFGQCWRMIDPKFTMCFGHNKQVKEVRKDE